MVIRATATRAHLMTEASQSLKSQSPSIAPKFAASLKTVRTRQIAFASAADGQSHVIGRRISYTLESPALLASERRGDVGLTGPFDRFIGLETEDGWFVKAKFENPPEGTSEYLLSRGEPFDVRYSDMTAKALSTSKF